jgi:hypothetical protein
MTDDSPSPKDVIRYVYLARELERLGDHESAQRWQGKAEEWLARQAATIDRQARRSTRTKREAG